MRFYFLQVFQLSFPFSPLLPARPSLPPTRREPMYQPPHLAGMAGMVFGSKVHHVCLRWKPCNCKINRPFPGCDGEQPIRYVRQDMQPGIRSRDGVRPQNRRSHRHILPGDGKVSVRLPPGGGQHGGRLMDRRVWLMS